MTNTKQNIGRNTVNCLLSPLGFGFSIKGNLSVLQVLYQTVNYQMEPVRTESGREADETDSVKVCVVVSKCKPVC